MVGMTGARMGLGGATGTLIFSVTIVDFQEVRTDANAVGAGQCGVVTGRQFDQNAIVSIVLDNRDGHGSSGIPILMTEVEGGGNHVVLSVLCFDVVMIESRERKMNWLARQTAGSLGVEDPRPVVAGLDVGLECGDSLEGRGW